MWERIQYTEGMTMEDLVKEINENVIDKMEIELKGLVLTFNSNIGMIIKKYLKPIETKTERLEIKITGIEKCVF